MKKEKKKPVASFGPYKTGGGSQIEAAIWKNEGEGDHAGKVWYAVSFARSYYAGTDPAGKDKFDRTTSLRQQDLPAVIYALQQAQSWIFEQRIQNGQDAREEVAAGADDF